MRRIFRAAVLPLSLLSSMAVISESHAQGLFDGLFGGGQQHQAPAEVPQRQGLIPPSPFGHRAPIYNPRSERERSESSTSDKSEKRASGRYRTLCVRLCDGYYFPISYATSRGGFYKDANICRASCGEEAKLFHHDKNDRDISEMVDNSGKPYVRLPTAFIYRKRSIDGCKCKPDPWSQSELDRHHAYALSEKASNDGGGSTGNAKAKVVQGASDPAVRAVFEKSDGDLAKAVIEGEVQSADKPSNAAPAEPTAGEAPRDSKPKLNEVQAVAKPKAKADRRPLTSASGSPSQPRPQPVRASAPAPAAMPAKSQPFGLGGGGQRWPGE